jgi:7-keto-8-aminopelargonate synthetase-like enzyme
MTPAGSAQHSDSSTGITRVSLNTEFTKGLEHTIDQLKADRVYKRLNYLDSPQAAHVKMEGRGDVLILSSNNYLGLSDQPSLIDAGHRRIEEMGRGNGQRTLHLRHLHHTSRARTRTRALRGL